MRTSRFACPACGRTLRFMAMNPEVSRVWVWCSYGTCHSKAANEGAIADSEDRAYAELVRVFEEEPGADP